MTINRKTLKLEGKSFIAASIQMSWRYARQPKRVVSQQVPVQRFHSTHIQLLCQIGLQCAPWESYKRQEPI